MERNVCCYRLDFSPEASTEERAQMCALLDAGGALVSCAYSTQRTGFLGLEYSREIIYAEITTMNDWEDAGMHKIMKDNPIFSKGSISRIS